MTRPIRTFATLALAATLLAPAASAGHDGDPIHDLIEQIACGFPTFVNLLNSLPEAVGRCTSTTDLVLAVVSPAPCAECSQSDALSVQDMQLTPGQDVQSVPLPPEDVPAVGPVSTPEVGVPIGTLQAGQAVGNPQRYCVTFTPANGGSPLFQCVDLGPAGPFVPPVPPTTLLTVDPVTVGPTPAVPEGSLGSTPAQRVPGTSVDIEIGHRWVESRLNQRVGPGLVNVWEPVDLDDAAALQWWAQNGHKTDAFVAITLKADGVPQGTAGAYLPFAGQAIAAASK